MEGCVKLCKKQPGLASGVVAYRSLLLTYEFHLRILTNTYCALFNFSHFNRCLLGSHCLIIFMSDWLMILTSFLVLICPLSLL